MNEVQTISKKSILIFLLITFALSSVFYTPIILNGKVGSGFGMYVTGLMWCPGIAAIITSIILKRKISLLGWKLNNVKLHFQSYLIPLLIALIAYVIIWVVGWGKFYDNIFVSRIAESFGFNKLPHELTIILYFLLMGIFGMPDSISTALGEEIGWRGFLVPALYKSMGYTKTSLLSGIIWGLWHFPILLFADYNNGTPAWFSLTCFTVLIISVSFIFTWYRIKSNSLWTAVLLHASHNLFIQSIFTPLTKDTGNTKYFIDEFGIVLPIVAICFAIYFWLKRAEQRNNTVANTTVLYN